MQFERAGAGLDLLDQAGGLGGVAFAGEAEIHREIVGRLDHPRDMPGAGRAGGGEGAGRRPGAAAQHRGHARHQRLLDLLRADEMDVGVEAPGGQDLALAGPTMMATPGWMSGLPALPIAWMSPSFRPTSAFTIPQ